ncbi:MAG: T9SS type A sorting domain-containing protein, partial [Bacteroidota bacterium]
YIDDDQLLISRLESGDNFVQYGVVLLNEDLDVIWAKDIMGEEFTFSALRGFSYPGKAAVAGTSPNGHFFLNVFDTSGVTACDLDSVEVESFIYEDLIIDDITNFLSLEELNSYQEHSFLTFSEISFEEIDFCSQTLSSELVEESSQFKISPNPATSSVSITSSQDIESVQILRLDGAFAKKFNGFDANRELDISDLSEGLYLVKIYTEEKVHSERLVKL